VIENSLYIAPVIPVKNAIGKKTAHKTEATPISAPVICFIDLRIANFGSIFSVLIILSVFSTTTMASSTRSPIARTSANILIVLIVTPKENIIDNVPNKTIGTVTVVISVARQF